jgi:hypothetical protein
VTSRFRKRAASGPAMRYFTIGVRSYSVAALRIAKYSCSTVLNTSTVV